MDILILLLVLLVAVFLINQFVGIQTPAGIIILVVLVLLLFGGYYGHGYLRH